VPVTETDFNLQGRIDNYRERLTVLLIALDRTVQAQLDAVNQAKLGGSGRVSYDRKPPRWTLTWKAKGRSYEVNLMAFAHGGAWVVQGRMGLDRPFRNLTSARPVDEESIRREAEDQITTDLA
jgi:acetyl esterase/lipase